MKVSAVRRGGSQAVGEVAGGAKGRGSPRTPFLASDQQVGGSSPSTPAIFFNNLGKNSRHVFRLYDHIVISVLHFAVVPLTQMQGAVGRGKLWMF